MEEKKESEKERGGEHEIEGRKEKEKLNFEVCLTRLSFIKVTISVTHASIYSLGSFLEKLLWEASLRRYNLATHTPLITKLTSLRSFLEKIPREARA